MRSGAELVRATFPYAVEDRRLTWYHTGITLVLMAFSETLALVGPWWSRSVGMVLTGLLLVRLFIIYHDALHGAVFKGSVWGQRLMSVVGILTLSPRSVWRETHDYHHRNNCKLPSTAIGSFPVVTTRHWRRMPENEKRRYAFVRHPFTILFGYFFLFLFGMCAASFVRDPKQHWASGVAPIVHFALAGLAAFLFGWGSAITGVIGVLFIACALGGYLFYAQHNYPGVTFQKRTEWSYHDAALKSSSYFKMSPVMHFFTGNIGYHHVHHLNHKIPFYRLKEAMENIPELQAPGETSWHPRDVWGALRLKLWDPTKNEMVPFPKA
ncbi:MAG: fatty acid desaturase [Alphaproteobacteria bacterium]|nr:fatty acid desaturase [Alphaproteobacteria bacterium]